MSTIKHITLLSLCCLLLQLDAITQDIHFSQILTTPNYINPALTGFFKGEARGILNHRNQWSAVTIPYITSAASADINIKVKTNRPTFVGYGVQLYSDKAGDSKFGTTQILMNASYMLALNTLSTQFLSFGISGGVGYRSLDYSQLHFDQQFDGYRFDPNIAISETFSRSSLYYPDLAAGVHWSNYYNLNLTFNTGASISHINKPAISLFNDSKTRLYRKLILYHSTQLIAVPNKLTITPMLVWSVQNTHQELLLGGSQKYRVYKNGLFPKPYSIILGVYTRWNDAFIVLTGIEIERLTLQFSYDINYSGLRKASLYRGGPEFSLVYIINNIGSNKQAKIMCPIF